jgi:choline dehydrogenase
MLSDERDLRRMRTAARLLAKLCRTEEVAAIAQVPVERSAADFYAAVDSGDDAQLDAYLLARGSDTQHATSTCRMGAADDQRSVVDAECRVIGFQALRVIDASVFPSVPRANTHLAVVAIAEAMADRIAR